MLPDPVGHLVIALGLGRLVPLLRGFGWARNAAVVVALCTALMALCRSPRVVGPARTPRWALPCVTVGGGLLGLVSVLAGARSDAGVSGMTEMLGGLLGLAGIVLVVSGIVLGIWFLLVLWRASREPVASAGPALR